ncbi:MAG: ABC transporter permease [Fuerstiella sp.]|nr:ABC transporter permease [Fuerstiella sp.]MCP4853663.1 ABC transporter permease [Fuerstiella sp.]
MWAYVLRRFFYNIPVFMGIVLLVMLALRVRDPVNGLLGKVKTEQEIADKRAELGLDKPFVQQYAVFLTKLCTLDFDEESWVNRGQTVGEVMRRCVGPSLALTVPSLVLTTLISVAIALMSAWYRGRWLDKALVISAVLGMSVSFLVYIVFGQYYAAAWLPDQIGWSPFSVSGYEPVEKDGIATYVLKHWPYYCLLPVLISVIVAMGYDTRFYRAVMVEESGRDYITTARAKGASQPKVMFVHMLKNAMIPIITRVVITIPFLITGSFLLEVYFAIPGMGKQLLTAVVEADFPIVQAFTAVFAAIYIASNLLTDVLYAVVDPRVRLS